MKQNICLLSRSASDGTQTRGTIRVNTAVRATDGWMRSAGQFDDAPLADLGRPDSLDIRSGITSGLYPLQKKEELGIHGWRQQIQAGYQHNPAGLKKETAVH
jgi:hypothetical protein